MVVRPGKPMKQIVLSVRLRRSTFESLAKIAEREERYISEMARIVIEQYVHTSQVESSEVVGAKPQEQS